MNFRFTTLILSAFFLLSCNEKPVQKTAPAIDTTDVSEQPQANLRQQGFPASEILEEFRNLSGTGTSLPGLTIDQDNVFQIPDSTLIRQFPLYDFYYLTVINSSAMEYNNGNVPVVAAVHKHDTGPVRLLLPLDYAQSAGKFFKLFIKEESPEIKRLCKSIAELLLRTERINVYCCREAEKSVRYSAFQDKDLYVIRINYDISCCPAAQAMKPNSFKQERFTNFQIRNNSLQRIEYSAWE